MWSKRRIKNQRSQETVLKSKLEIISGQKGTYIKRGRESRTCTLLAENQSLKPHRHASNKTMPTAKTTWKQHSTNKRVT